MTSEIKISGLFGEIYPTVTNKAVEAELRQKLSFVEPDNLNTLLELYSDSGFYSGCYKTVQKVLESYGIKTKVTFHDVVNVLKTQLSSNVGYRQFQEEAVKAALEHRFGIIQAPPGTGKTFIAGKIVEAVNTRSLILVEDTAPYRQMISTFDRFFNYSTGEIKTKNYKVKDINVAMLQTLIAAYKRNNLKDESLFKFLEGVECLIIDEVHHVQADAYIDIIHLFPNLKYFIGLSATPYSTNGKDLILSSVVGPVIYKISYPQTIDAGILVPTTLYTEKVPHKSVSSEVENATAFDKHRELKDQLIVNNKQRNTMILDYVDYLNSEQKSCAIIIDRIEHGKILQKMYGKDKLILVEGSLNEKEREAIWAKLKRKEYLAVASTLIDEAVDLPSLDGVAYASGGKSRVKAIQRLRSTRTFEGETVFGKEKKTRGFAYLPIDEHKNLKKHSVETRDYILDFFEDHPLNEHEQL